MAVDRVRACYCLVKPIMNTYDAAAAAAWSPFASLRRSVRTLASVCVCVDRRTETDDMPPKATRYSPLLRTGPRAGTGERVWRERASLAAGVHTSVYSASGMGWRQRARGKRQWPNTRVSIDRLVCVCVCMGTARNVLCAYVVCGHRVVRAERTREKHVRTGIRLDTN